MATNFHRTVAGVALAALSACADGGTHQGAGATPSAALAIRRGPNQAALPFEMPNARAHLPPLSAAAAASHHVASVRFTDLRASSARQAILQLGHLDVFEATTGLFRPEAPISRAEYVRWLVRANNAFFAFNRRKQIALSEARQSTFADLPASHPDFAYVQGMADAGYPIGTDAWHFAPDRWLTREELLAILVTRDKNGSNEQTTKDRPPTEVIHDGALVSQRYWQVLRDDQLDMSISTHDNLHRIFGDEDVLQPKRLVTRAEAARSLQWIDGVYAGDAR